MDTETLEITYGGKPMLAPDPAGELVAHIQQHFSHFFEPANPLTYAPSNLRQTCCENRPPLVLPRWNQEPRLGLYQLYMPCGFTRPMRMYGLLETKHYMNDFLSVRGRKLQVDIWGQSASTRLSQSLISLYMDVVDAVEVTKDVMLVRFVDSTNDLRTGSTFAPVVPKPSRMTVSEFADLLGPRVFGGGDWLELRRGFLKDLPDTYADLDSLWRPGELVSVLLEALLGAYASRPFYFQGSIGHHYYPNSDRFFNAVDAFTPSSSKLPPSNLYREIGIVSIAQSNGRKRCDLWSPTLTSNNAISVSAVNVTGGVFDSDPDFPQKVKRAEDQRFLIGVGYRRVGTYGLEFKTVDADYRTGGYDSQIIDLNPAGGGRVSSFIPVQAFPIQRHYYWITDEKPTCEPEDVIRVQLLEDMPVCGDAAAFHLSDLVETENCPCGPVKQVLLVDTAGIARSRIRNGQRYAPAQSMGFAKQLRCGDTGEANVYELISVGQGCCPVPGSSVYEPCCNQWFTRFDNLGTVTDKAVGAEITYGETVGQLKGFGASELKYKAYLASSDAYDGCAIDLSGIHAFGTKNSRTSGTSPCTPGFDQCAIDYALLKMSGRLPVDPAACEEWYEDLAAAGTGDDYFRRTIESKPENCSYSKKVYNFTNAKTTVLTKGADYVVLKHWCDPTSSSSSSSGVDACCVILTDYDMRCVGGRLQRWKQETEVCWNGDCLEKRIVRPWFYTGERAGCCDCGSGTSSSTGSSGSHDPNCCDTCCAPSAVVTIGDKTYSDFTLYTGIGCSKTYSLVIEVPTAEAPSCLLDEDLLCWPTSFWLRVNVVCSESQSDTWTVFAEYVLRGSIACGDGVLFSDTIQGNCPIPYTRSGTGATGVFNGNEDCPWTVTISCAGGPTPDPDPEPPVFDPEPRPWPPGDPRPPVTDASVTLGDRSYQISLCGFEFKGAGQSVFLPDGAYRYTGQIETSTIPSQLLNDNLLGGGTPTRMRLTMVLLATTADAAQSGWQASLNYELYQLDGTRAAAGRILEYGNVIGGSSNPIGQSWSNTGTTQLRADAPFNTDMPWSIAVTSGAATARLSGLTAEFVSSDRPLSASPALNGVTTSATAVIAHTVLSSNVTLEGIKTFGGDSSYSVLTSLSGASTSSSFVIIV